MANPPSSRPFPDSTPPFPALRLTPLSRSMPSFCSASPKPSSTAEMLHLVAFLLRLLALVLGFASFVLAAISLRHVERRWGSYFAVDPALLACGILTTAWFLASVAINRITPVAAATTDLYPPSLLAAASSSVPTAVQLSFTHATSSSSRPSFSPGTSRSLYLTAPSAIAASMTALRRVPVEACASTVRSATLPALS